TCTVRPPTVQSPTNPEAGSFVTVPVNSTSLSPSSWAIAAGNRLNTRTSADTNPKMWLLITLSSSVPADSYTAIEPAARPKIQPHAAESGKHGVGVVQINAAKPAPGIHRVITFEPQVGAARTRSIEYLTRSCA